MFLTKKQKIEAQADEINNLNNKIAGLKRELSDTNAYLEGVTRLNKLHHRSIDRQFELNEHLVSYIVSITGGKMEEQEGEKIES